MKLGFIGCGNMSTAMICGILKNNIVDKTDITASTATEKSLRTAKEKLGINVTLNNKDVAQNADLIVIGVKPHIYADIAKEIKDILNPNQIIVSIAPAKTLKWLGEQFGEKAKIVRTMPNTPAMVGEAMTAVCFNEYLTENEKQQVCHILESFGKVEIMSENLIDSIISVSGSSPAYVFMFIEAMADAACADGVPRQQAYRLAAQSVLGSAKMVLETGMHPAQLKDMVCSPAGTTIEAVRVLEQKGFRSAIIEAMRACNKKSKEM